MTPDNIVKLLIEDSGPNASPGHNELWEGTWAEYLQANCDDDPEELARIETYLDAGHCYTGGGGAAPFFTVYTAETSQPSSGLPADRVN